ncbi:toll/interleukin-1 receptor domain-containing protein [Herpetosiphon gulosus]|uniref:TIR domain-containing protein n=1 Tax=Herpetosiphon gulosus TaxID=1973496 RepID=A0ABP9X329_9CHLR
MAQVFLSHKTQDKKLVLETQKYLSQCLISSWIDINDIRDGASLTPEILRAINECKYFVAFISHDYIRSNWCKEEIFQAKQLSIENKITIIPVLLCSKDDLHLNNVGDDVKYVIESLINRNKYINFDIYNQNKSNNEIIETISEHNKIKFSPINKFDIEGTYYQQIEFEIVGGTLPVDFLTSWKIDIEADFLNTKDQRNTNKPIMIGVNLLIKGKGPIWIYSYFTIQFKNICPVYIYDLNSNRYICVYDNNRDKLNNKIGTSLIYNKK